jgi:hypothetical protein
MSQAAVEREAPPAKLSWLQSLEENRLRSTLILVGVGVVLLALAWLCENLSMRVPETGSSPCDVSNSPCGHQVGYLYAPNWAFATLILWPAMLFVLAGLIRQLDQSFKDIDHSPMTWLAAEDGSQSVLATWKKRKATAERIIPFVLLLAVAISLAEWWWGSARFLVDPDLLETAGDVERDWSSIQGQAGSYWVQVGMTLLAFLYHAIALTLMVTFVLVVLLAAKTMDEHGSGRSKPELLIDIESNDPGNRAGFERFMVPIDQMIVFVALVFLNFFLSRIQNAYVRTSEWSDIGLFIAQEFTLKAGDGIEELVLIEHLDFTSVAVMFGAVIALFVCFFFFNATLRHVAIQARNRSDHVLMKPAMLSRSAETGLDAVAVRDRLKNANAWPLGYSDLMPTMSFLAICVAVILFYRIGLYVIFLWILGWIVTRAASGLLKR